MSQTVSRESLNALAVAAFAEIIRQDNGAIDFDEETPSNAMFHVLNPVYADRTQSEEQSAFVSGFQEGTEFGLAVAAAIVTHGLDHVAVAEAVRAELDCDRYWPEAEPKAA